MKNFLLNLLGSISLVGLILLNYFVLCPTEEKKNEINEQFIVLEQFDNNCGLCYDKDTKIIYLYDNDSYSPYYVMNVKDEPVIGVYNGDN